MSLFQRLVTVATIAVSLVLAGAHLWGRAHMSVALAANQAAKQTPVASCGGDAALRSFFKGAPAGMKVKDKVELYDEKGLFNYIDGGAPLYIKHHFRRLGAAEMSSDGSGELTCDIYDMDGPANALSIFTAEKSSAFKPVAGWPEAHTSPMSFVFHQGCYYVKLTAFDKKAESAMPALAGALRERMQGTPHAATHK